MNVAWGVVVAALAALAWLGQTISWLAPAAAARWNLTEDEGDVEPMFWADGRGEAMWDAFTLWTMVAAGILLIADHDAWPYFGLVGGGTYAYFGGRGILTRVEMRRRGMRIGSPDSVRVGFTFLAIWTIMAVVMIVASVIALET